MQVRGQGIDVKIAVGHGGIVGCKYPGCPGQNLPHYAVSGSGASMNCRASLTADAKSFSAGRNQPETRPRRITPFSRLSGKSVVATRRGLDSPVRSSAETKSEG